MQTIRITYDSADMTNDADGIAQAQTLGGAGNLTLNGALVSGGVASWTLPQLVSFNSAANLSSLNFTIYGTDLDGREFSETIAGPNAGTTQTTEYFVTVTQIAVDGAVGTNVTAGVLSADGTATRPLVVDRHIAEFMITLQVDMTGTASVTGQQTLNNVYDSVAVNWLNVSGMVGATITTQAAITTPQQAVRFIVPTLSSGTVTFTVMQSGD